MRQNIKLAVLSMLFWVCELACAEPPKSTHRSEPIMIEMVDFRLRQSLPVATQATVVVAPIPAIVPVESDADSDFSDASAPSRNSGYISSDSSVDDNTRFKITPQELVAARRAILLKGARQRALLDHALDLLLSDATGLTSPPG